MPVFGFRPMRWPFLRTVNVPNDDSLTVSPRAMQSVISFKKKFDETRRLDSRQTDFAIDRVVQIDSG